jgi:diapolycopene oxygenase
VKRRAVVVGAGQGGLSAALALAADGWEVQVLEQRDAVGGKAAPLSVGEFDFDPGPSILILPQVYRSALAAAGADPEVLRFERLDPVTRVFAGGGTPTDLPASLEGCLDMVGRSSPADRRGLETVFSFADRLAPWIEPWLFGEALSPATRGLVTAGVRPWAPYGAEVRRLLATPWLRAVFLGFPSYSGLADTDRGVGPFFIPYYMWKHGVWRAKGGVRAIPAAFRAACEAAGVGFRLGCRVTGLAVEGRRAVAVRTQEGDVGADAVVVNADRPGFEALLGRPAPRAEPATSYFTLSLGLRSPAPGLAHHSLFVPAAFEDALDDLYRRARPPAQPVVYWNDVSDEAPAGRAMLFAVVTVPALREGVDWGDEGPRLRAEALHSLASCGVAVDEGDIMAEAVQTPATFEARDGNWRGSLYGPGGSARGWSGLGAGQRDPLLRNVFYCGGSVRPGAGLPMVTVSGRMAARLASRMAG